MQIHRKYFVFTIQGKDTQSMRHGRNICQLCPQYDFNDTSFNNWIAANIAG